MMASQRRPKIVRVEGPINPLIHAFLALVIGGLTAIGTQAAPGDLDLTFSVDGKVNICPAVPLPSRVVVQPDGKILTAAWSDVDGESFISRHNADGTPDETFGNAPFGFTGLVYFNDYGALRILVKDIALLPNGNILAVGHSSPKQGQTHFSAFRFFSDGTLDTSFGTNGRLVVWNSGGRSYGDRIALQDDGKFVVAGRVNGGLGILTARYDQNGTRDTGYAGGVYASALVNFSISELLIQRDGKILVSVTYLADTASVYRLDPDGKLDDTFGTSGRLETGLALGSYFLGMALQTDGKIVISGAASGNISSIKRYDPNGGPDVLFGTNGIVSIAEPKIAGTVVIQKNGRIVIAGSKDGKFALSRYDRSGDIDDTFGVNGVVTTSFPPASGHLVFALALQPDGKILAAGLVGNGSSGMARYLGDSVNTDFDFDGDARADLGVFRPSDRVWYLNRSSQGFFAEQFGLTTDKPVPADYDGDGKTDIAIYRDGFWWWINSSNGTLGVFQFGLAGDVPQPADYDGDGQAELAVFRSFAEIWYVFNLATNQSNIVYFLEYDKPVVGDYDGDGRADYAHYVRSTHSFWVLMQSTAGIAFEFWGTLSDKAVPADYDGDGKTDLAVFRPSDGNWYIRNSSDGNTQIVNWGLATDRLVPADYDGDGKADIAIFRDGVWWINQSSSGIVVTQFGLASDLPLSARN